MKLNLQSLFAVYLSKANINFNLFFICLSCLIFAGQLSASSPKDRILKFLDEECKKTKSFIEHHQFDPGLSISKKQLRMYGVELEFNIQEDNGAEEIYDPSKLERKLAQYTEYAKTQQNRRLFFKRADRIVEKILICPELSGFLSRGIPDYIDCVITGGNGIQSFNFLSLENEITFFHSGDRSKAQSFNITENKGGFPPKELRKSYRIGENIDGIYYLNSIKNKSCIRDTKTDTVYCLQKDQVKEFSFEDFKQFSNDVQRSPRFDREISFSLSRSDDFNKIYSYVTVDGPFAEFESIPMEYKQVEDLINVEFPALEKISIATTNPSAIQIHAQVNKFDLRTTIRILQIYSEIQDDLYHIFKPSPKRNRFINKIDKTVFNSLLNINTTQSKESFYLELNKKLKDFSLPDEIKIHKFFGLNILLRCCSKTA